MNRTVFITGATSGIGRACAEVFAENGDNLILNGRREERLNDLKNELESRFKIKVVTLAFDVTNKAGVFTSIESITSTGQEVDILVNNAGLALGRDSFEEADIQDWETMINTNINGLLYVSKAVLPMMTSRKKGHIVNLGSVAGKEAYEKGNVYCGTKAAVDLISRSMRIDLLPYNIKITAIHPGAVETEFSIVRFKGDMEKAANFYKGFTPLSARDVADVIFYACSLPEHVCLNDIVLTPTQQANAIYINKNS